MSAPLAPDHTAALPFCSVFCWSLKRAPAAMSAWTVAVDVERLAEAKP